MRRTITFLCLLAIASFSAACSSSDNTNGVSSNGNTTRTGVIETNANLSPRTNGNTVSSNTAVLTNDNHNANTAGISTTNANSTGGSRNSNTHNSNTHP